jgi:hypothetical protein
VLTTGTVQDTPTGQGDDIFAMADFANKYLGGGVLGGGCVQEEILLRKDFCGSLVAV